MSAASDTPPAGYPDQPPGRGRLVTISLLERVPWWVLVLLIGGVFALFGIARSPVYVETYQFLARVSSSPWNWLYPRMR